ncbi:MAG: SUF system NifU family Fe-S cluster assembly protein [Planctomycetes bacterium]|nr:SUF system NifU family Fe-S cluster assembly protein [Planctomycetota bacterium]
MTHAADLYQELILDHGRRPRNHRALDGASGKADGHNPLCGDRVTVFVRVEGGVVADVTFVGTGCAISQASSSLMTEAVRGRSVAEVEALFGRFHDLVTGTPADDAAQDALGKLAAFAGVAEFPMRVKCATLAWHTLRAALAGPAAVGAPVTTEDAS